MNHITKPVNMRHLVNRLEDEFSKLPQVNCPIRHYFAPGMYAREITIPAGTVVTGAVHKTENLIVVSMGRLKIVTDEGTREVQAPGDRRACDGVRRLYLCAGGVCECDCDPRKWARGQLMTGMKRKHKGRK